MDQTEEYQPATTEASRPRQWQRQAYVHLHIRRGDQASFISVSVDWHRHSEPTASATRIAVEHETRHPLIVRITTGRPAYQPVMLGSSRQDRQVRFEFMIEREPESEEQEVGTARLPNVRFVVRRLTSITGYFQTGLDVVLDLVDSQRPRRQRRRRSESLNTVRIQATGRTLDSRFTTMERQASVELSVSRRASCSRSPSDLSRASSSLWSSLADVEERDRRLDPEETIAAVSSILAHVATHNQ